MIQKIDTEYKIGGIDLAGLPKNPSGVCIIDREIHLSTLYTDEEIIGIINKNSPEIVAIDAPIMDKIRIRKADKILKKYGAMPPTLPSMKILTERAKRIVSSIKSEVIEVFPTASAKIMGLYDRNWHKMAENFGIFAENKHQLDAYIACYTAYLYLNGMAEEVGGRRKVVIPKVF